VHRLNDGISKMKIQKPSNKTYKGKSSSKLQIFDKFATYYDQIYHDKNYEQECNFIISVLRKFGKSNVKNILDLGCGTGGHTLILTKSSYSVTGLDMSNIALQLASRKSQRLKLNCEFVKGNMSNFNLGKKFDACISMFCSFCYLTKATEYKKTLRCILNHLNPGGLLIFDFWNGNAVVNEKPSTKVKIVKIGRRRIIRIATPTIDYSKQICTIAYHCIVIENDQIVDEFQENHNIKYHFPEDLSDYLNDAGFEIVKIMPMIDSSRKSRNNTYLNEWYLFAIARKKR